LKRSSRSDTVSDVIFRNLKGGGGTFRWGRGTFQVHILNVLKMKISIRNIFFTLSIKGAP